MMGDMAIADIIKQSIKQALQTLGIDYEGNIVLDHPQELSHGDYATNIALVLAKQLEKNPHEVALQIVEKLNENKPVEIADIQVAGPGFINFTLANDFFKQSIAEIQKQKENFGHNSALEGKRIMIEYTDPNPFKVFHIGHLMSNAIGESIARLYEYAGATVVRACYQGDVGLHVAKAMWGILQNKENFPNESDTLSTKTKYLGEAYVTGSEAYEQDEQAKKEINELNRTIFEGHNDDINHYYKVGRAWSLEHFEEIYQKLGTKFVHYFFESDVAEKGMAMVEEQLDNGVFRESEGAIIFDGEPYGLHKRVFMNSLGLPTYEAKEIGLNITKYETEPELDLSIVITAEEQKEYMRVVLKAIEQFWPEVTEKTLHMTHGMMRFAGGKMSSRTGNVITGESLIEDLEALALEKIESSDRGIADPKTLATQVAVAGIKFSVLRQAAGKNIVFDPEQSLSFEGDSGPYLQYTYARTQSLLQKGAEANVTPVLGDIASPEELARTLYRFPEVVTEAQQQNAPHHVANYLIEIARAFNSWYGNTQILDDDAEQSAHRLAIVDAVGTTIKNGLNVLGIEAPDKM